jgi:putative transposase
MRGVTFVEGSFYHIYNRGVDKRKVFMSPSEYRRFLAYLILLNDTEPVRADVILKSGRSFLPEKERNPLVAIGAYCLMSNHFHLYLTPLVEGGISKFMQRLLTAYTMYFNEKHDRSGSLFQGTFKAELVDNDVYAKYLFSYIHMNPAKIVDPQWKELGARDIKKLRTFIETYPYSSFQEFKSHNHFITSPSQFPEYFSESNELLNHIESWFYLRSSVEG